MKSNNHQIRLRAWVTPFNPEEERVGMVEINSMELPTGKVSTSKGRFDTDIYAIRLMQFTGLYDMDKAPIYEGDLLIGVTNDKQVATCEVVYFPCRFRLHPVINTTSGAERAGKPDAEFDFSEADNDYVLVK